MKRRLIAIGLVLAAFLAVVYTVFFYDNLGVSVGYYLNTNGGAMLIKDNSPICLTPRPGKGNIFSGFEEGEKLLVVHDGIAESYPAQTGVYFIISLGGASPDNIPAEVKISLAGLGWLDDTGVFTD